MASIKQRGNSFFITISNGYDIYGTKIRETATFVPDPSMTPKQQEKALEKFVFEFEEKVKNGKYLDGEKISFKEFSEKWMNEYSKKALEMTTYNSYQQYLDQKIFPAIGHLKMARIQPVQLNSFYNNLQEDGVRKDGKPGCYSQSTIKKCHAIISSIFSTAVQWQVVEANPCERISPKKKKDKSKREAVKDVKHFTLEQSQIFLSIINDDFKIIHKAHDRIDDTGKKYHVNDYIETHSIPTQLRVFFNLAIFSGLRRGELIALEWSDIDFNNNVISVTKSTAYSGKETITKVPKNESSVREINIPGSVMDMLKKYRNEQKELRLSLGDQWQGENYIFIQWNGKQMNLCTPYQCFKEVIKRYNFTIENVSEKLPDIPLHGLRHTSATLLISENIDVNTVSARLGHAQTSTTLNIYSHALKKKDEKASDTLENLFKKKA
jgi:integrase